MHLETLGTGRSGKPALEPGLALAVAGSIHAAFNGAYIYPQLASMHELLSVAAWLGHLVRGRPAFMPLFAAEYLVDELGCGAREGASDWARASNLLRLYAESAVGVERLRAMARRVVTSGKPALVLPNPGGGDVNFAAYVWDDELFTQIAERLGDYPRT
jgi:hypothetical protein